MPSRYEKLQMNFKTNFFLFYEVKCNKYIIGYLGAER